MADVKISELTALTSPDGGEELVVNDSGTTKKITIANATSAALPKAGGTMTGVIAGFESTGIDDNATSTAITIDASENVLVGKTTIAGAFNTVGTELRATGLVQSTVDGNKCIDLNRKTSDGAILGFSKDGTAVGSIGTEAGDLHIGTDDTGIQFVNGINAIAPVNSTNGSDRDAAISLGHASGRFKDLYLSGGVYLGGTAAANTLDDYEEGTWTPVPTQGSVATISATYTKIGRMVTVHGQELAFSNTTSGVTLEVAGLPFAPSHNTGAGTSMWENMAVAGTFSTCFVLSNNRIRFYTNSTTGGFNACLYNKLGNGAAVYFTLTYPTNS